MPKGIHVMYSLMPLLQLHNQQWTKLVTMNKPTIKVCKMLTTKILFEPAPDFRAI